MQQVQKASSAYKKNCSDIILSQLVLYIQFGKCFPFIAFHLQISPPAYRKIITGNQWISNSAV